MDPAHLLLVSREAMRRAAARLDSDAIAHRVSDYVAPLSLAILVWVPLSLRFAPSFGVAAANVLLAILFFFVVPLLVPLYYVHRGMDTLHVARRELRFLPMVVALAGYGVYWYVEGVVLRIPALANVLLFFMWASVPVILVTLRWKISVHMGGNAVAIATLAQLHPWAWALSLLHLPVGWARIRLKAHTPAQVVVGAAYGTAVTLLHFQFFPLVP